MSTITSAGKSKIIHYDHTATLDKILPTGKKVLVGGCFDILHFGHITFLKNARAQGQILIVALEPDEFIRKKKNKQPIHSQKQRAEILASLTYVDIVLLLPILKSDQEYLTLVKKVSPTVIAVTAGDPYLNAKKIHARQADAEIKIVTPHIAGFSSSHINTL